MSTSYNHGFIEKKILYFVSFICNLSLFRQDLSISLNIDIEIPNPIESFISREAEEK